MTWWDHLRDEIEAEFYQPHPLAREAPPTGEWFSEGWSLFVVVHGEEARARAQRLREELRRAGLCIRCREPRAPDSKNYCPYHVVLNRPSARKRLVAGIAASPATARPTPTFRPPAPDECPEHRRPLRLRLERGTYYCTKKGCGYEQPRRERGMREKLVEDGKEQTRRGVTQHFKILGPGELEVDGYVTTGEYPDGRLGEVFMRVGKAGSSSAMFDQWAIAVSMAIQYGAPIDVLLGKHVGTQFEPAGAVEGVEGIKRCTSPLDLICRYLLRRYGKKEAT